MFFQSVLYLGRHAARFSTRTWRPKETSVVRAGEEREHIDDIPGEASTRDGSPGVCHFHRGARCRRTHRTCSSTGGRSGWPSFASLTYSGRGSRGWRTDELSGKKIHPAGDILEAERAIATRMMLKPLGEQFSEASSSAFDQRQRGASASAGPFRCVEICPIPGLFYTDSHFKSPRAANVPAAVGLPLSIHSKPTAMIVPSTGPTT